MHLKKSRQFGRFLRPLVRTLKRPFVARRKSRPVDQVHLALVIPLNDEVAEHLTKIQIEIFRKYGYNPGLDAYPHITLKMGFPVKHLAPFEDYMEYLASRITPFEISTGGFDFFDDGIMFLGVESNPQLERIRQEILADLSEKHGIMPETVEGAQFRFHVTLAYGLSNKEFAELRESYASRHLQFTFTARHIDLFCHTGQQWVTCKRAVFRGADPIALKTSSRSS